MVQRSRTSNNLVVELVGKYLLLFSIISIQSGINYANLGNFIADKF